MCHSLLPRQEKPELNCSSSAARRGRDGAGRSLERGLADAPSAAVLRGALCLTQCLAGDLARTRVWN